MSGKAPSTRLFTLGHGALPLERFVALLSGSSIRVVADVRSNPASPRFPWFERAALARELESHGLSYRWFRVLGGRLPPNPEEREHPALTHEWQRIYAAAMNRPAFHSACENLIGLSASALVAVLCAELNPERCHRFLLADKLAVMGARVVHILGPEAAVDHTLHPELEVQYGQGGEPSRLVYAGRQLSML
ncbi:MAG TPA: DUF488 domain-containing protein [Polyangia bacterium]|nr:DUF488 domain-containing protein [Polyangia bacterium]